ncbi:MAG TPA: hypothetical protein PKG95_12700 [Anaerolineaceae bacterium]|nr:hypothetical protein [Anaerolineaceae bacterium]
MRIPTPEETNLIRQALDLTLPDTPWPKLLETFLVSGVADTQQMQAATGLSRGQLDRVLIQLDAACAGLPPALRRYDGVVRRPGQPGKPPRIYTLSESGAALLRELGYADANPCGLTAPLAVLHAQAMLAFHQCAERASQSVESDRSVPYGTERSLRPDHQVQMADGRRLLYEIEQEASPQLLRRMRQALEHRQAFFSSEQAAGYLPQVRILFNPGRGRIWQRTLAIWRQTIRQLAAETDSALAFQVLAMPLNEFLAQPDWSPDPSELWEDLAGNLEAAEQPSSAIAIPATALELAARYRSLQAELLAIQELVTSRLGEDEPRPNFVLLAYAMMIFEASYADTGNLPNLATPHAAVTLLGRYLAAQPGLVAALRQAMHPQRARMAWNNTTILHAMQRVLNAFMLYHGWSNTGPLRAVAAISTGWEEYMTGPYVVQVTIGLSILTVNLIPYAPRLRVSLAWMLWALFEYAEVLSLGKPEYW